MASNEIPTTYTSVVALGEDAADGAQIHGVAIGLKQNTEAAIRADLTALITAETTVGQKKLAKATASATHKTADSNGKAFIARFIQLEKSRLGADWGPLWQEAGFTAGSISNPTTLDDRFILLNKLMQFLKLHPEYNVTDASRPDLDLTEASALAAYTAVSAARTGINDASVENGDALATRDTRLSAMRARLTGLRGELAQLPLPDDSPLWYAFGFNRPADPATPGIPDQLILTAGAAGTGALIADWVTARRATSYRVKIQVAGEPLPRLFGLFADDQATLTGLPSGTLLTVTVIAHNAAGYSADSPPATITLA
ncbi:MAG: fibronectin type III domain-containing protein [Verrucomicrobiota bacterium]